jgi:hypothetical protein
MTTTIDTAPAGSYTVFDNTSADTITVSDGPPENGFQTTQITDATDTFILANKSAVIIDGSNLAHTVHLDNPDPAAGLQVLTIQHLGNGSVIDGSNSVASSPDITVGSLIIASAPGDIGHSRPLRTQVNYLIASDSGVGNITFANGVSTPTTLTIGLLSTGGSITFTNNGTVNDFNGGISATGTITIDAFGATADFNTGSGAGITSTNGAIVNGGTGVGEDTNLGDGVGAGSMSAATGITWQTGRNFTMNAAATVTNSHIPSGPRRRFHHADVVGKFQFAQRSGNC